MKHCFFVTGIISAKRQKTVNSGWLLNDLIVKPRIKPSFTNQLLDLAEFYKGVYFTLPSECQILFKADRSYLILQSAPSLQHDILLMSIIEEQATRLKCALLLPRHHCAVSLESTSLITSDASTLGSSVLRPERNYKSVGWPEEGFVNRKCPHNLKDLKCYLNILLFHDFSRFIWISTKI